MLLCARMAFAQEKLSTDAHAAFNYLNRIDRRVSWALTSGLAADFDHDRKDDYAFSGTEGGQYVVAIVRGSSEVNPKRWLFRFSIAKPSKKITEICSSKPNLETRSPVILGSRKRMWEIPPTSKALVVDDGCDPVNISWDQDEKRFELLRIHVLL